MEKYYINEVKYAMSNGGMACSMVEGAKNVSVSITEGEKRYWITNSEVVDTPCFFLTTEDIFDQLLAFDGADDIFAAYMSKHSIDSFKGIYLGEYEDIENELNTCKDMSTVKLIRYIIRLTKKVQPGVNEHASVEKYINEI